MSCIIKFANRLSIKLIFVSVIILINGQQNFNNKLFDEPICPEDSQSCCSLDGTHWSDVQSKCVALERTSCSEILGCTDNAFCFKDNICHCEDGFSHTRDGYCLPGYGTKCDTTSEFPTITSCNADNFLQCNSQKMCTCQPGYRREGSLCRAQPGQKCDLKVTPDMTKVFFCITSATCTPGNITEDGDTSQVRVGRCVCPSTIVEDTETGDITCSPGTRTRLLLGREIFLAILITTVIF